MLPKVVLKSGRDKSVRNRHPRLFAGGIKQIDGFPKDGDAVDVFDNNDEWLARGVINQQAQIAVRLMTWDPTEAIDPDLWRKRTHAAVARRSADPNLAETNARRLIFGESDGMPGVVADDYGGHIVLQLSTLAASNARAQVVEALVDAVKPVCIIERSDEERLKHERVKEEHGLAYGEMPDAPVGITEGGLTFMVDLRSGQKTGFYLDQRENRARVARYAHGARVLNAFAFTGAFGVYAAAKGAVGVVNLDSSAEALRLAEEHFVINANVGEDAPPHTAAFVCADAFTELRGARKSGEQYDIVILDPPKFAHSVPQIEKAARAYKDLNRVGMALVRPGGLLATFSCSGVIGPELFQKILFSASIEAKRDAQVIERLSQASDHPVLLSFPESEYLKGLILRVM